MKVVETLLPVILLILLGFGLGRIRFLSEEAIGHLTRLVFWIALPALVIRSTAHVRTPIGQVLGPLGIAIGATLLILGLALLIAKWRRSPPPVAASMAQSAFRGNLAFVGLPIIAYSLADLPADEKNAAVAIAVMILGPMMVLYNILAIVVLLGCQKRSGLEGVRLIGRALATNPIILGSLLGMFLSWQAVALPLFVDRFLESLAGVTVPLALISIGASFTTLSLHGRRTALWIAVALKVIGTPLIVWILCRSLGYTGIEERILLIFAAAPTAAASYIMSRQMGADAELAATTIALSSAFCMGPLAVIIWLT